MSVRAMYIHELPSSIRRRLVTRLNAADAWRDLAADRLGFQWDDIQRFEEARYKPGDSPANT